MKKSSIEEILYGAWRPWLEEGQKALMDIKNEWMNKGHHKKINWFSIATIPESYNRYSAAYREIMEEGSSSGYRSLLCEVDKRRHREDKRFLYLTYKRKLETYLKDIASLSKEYAGSGNEGADTDKLVSFVLDTLSLLIGNILIDMSLRFTSFTKNTEDNIEHHIFLQLLDCRPPKPSPFRTTANWYRRSVYAFLKKYVNDQDTESKLGKLLQRLQSAAKGRGNLSDEEYDIQELLRHIENAVLLVKLEAPFLDKTPEQIIDPDICREWVRGLKEDMINRTVNQALIKEINRLNRVQSWFDNKFRVTGRFFSGLMHSEARSWMREIYEVTRRTKNTTPVAEISSNSEQNVPPMAPFSDFFELNFVHKSELAQALGVVTKSVDNYLEDESVKTLTFGSNVWYVRDSLEALLERHSEEGDV